MVGMAHLRRASAKCCLFENGRGRLLIGTHPLQLRMVRKGAELQRCAHGNYARCMIMMSKWMRPGVEMEEWCVGRAPTRGSKTLAFCLAPPGPTCRHKTHGWK
jgi:hypothetical protein